jgi:putative hydrolase of the HAD superfamily
MDRGLIFDLDSCLSPADEAGRQLFRPAFDAIIRANQGSHTREVLQQAFEDMWRLPYDFVSEKFHFTKEMVDAGWNELLQVEVTSPMSGYGDLPILSELPGALFLVTSGFRRLQESKIRALGINRWFKAIYVDAIDEPGHRGKQPIFEEIIKSNHFRPEQVVIIGDNPDSELAVGLRLGLLTVQTLRPGVPYAAGVAHRVRNLQELKNIL